MENQFEFLLSSVLLDANGGMVGVIATEFSSNVSEQFNEIRILDSGFAALVSNSGTVLTDPHVWSGGTLSGQYRIYQEDLTGIDLTTWLEILDSDLPEDKIFDIEIPGQGDYFLARSFVKDIHD